MKPYSDEQIDEFTKIRSFSSDVDSSKLVWHRDLKDRKIKVLDGEGWYFQKDNELPVLLKNNDILKVSAMTYHRLIRGETDLRIKISESE